LKSSEKLVKIYKGSGEHMVRESVYQIQVGWASMKEHSNFMVGGWELLRE